MSKLFWDCRGSSLILCPWHDWELKPVSMSSEQSSWCHHRQGQRSRGPLILALGGTANHGMTGCLRSQHCTCHWPWAQTTRPPETHPQPHPGTYVHIIQGPIWRQKLYLGFWFGIFYVDIFITENLIKLVLPINLIANFIDSTKRTLSYHIGRNLSLLGLQTWKEEAGISRTAKLREGSLLRWNGSVRRKD